MQLSEISILREFKNEVKDNDWEMNEGNNSSYVDIGGDIQAGTPSQSPSNGAWGVTQGGGCGGNVLTSGVSTLLISAGIVLFVRKRRSER